MRTNIEIDDAMVGQIMREKGLATKRAAVEFALGAALREIDREARLAAFDSLRGIGWEGDLDTMRRDKPRP